MKVHQSLIGRKRDVLAVILECPEASPTVIAKRLGCSMAVAFQALKDLRQAGIIRKIPASHALQVPVMLEDGDVVKRVDTKVRPRVKLAT